MVDVFISYSRTNQEMVRQLAEAVKREGYRVWWDEELPPHLSYGDVITEKIGAAKAAIVVWSHDAAASEWVRAEADVARNQKKLIQTSIDERMPPMPFNQIQFASIGDWRGEHDHPGWMKVKASLEALVGPAVPSTEPFHHPIPIPTPAPAAASAAPHRWHKLLIAVIAVAFLFVAGAGLFAWLRGGASAPPVQTPPQTARPAERGGAAPPDAARAPPQPPSRAGPVQRANVRRLCIGRSTPECAQLRRLYARQRRPRQPKP